jgi:putative tryptophan/tyrosine transport system substrate-binding protein
VDRRRFLLTGLGGVVTAPLAAKAQVPAKRARIGYLRGEAEDAEKVFRTAFVEALELHGWVEGKNLQIEVRHADGVNDALPRLAAELVAARVDVIMTVADAPSALAAKRATRAIPIVFTTGADPVQLGLVPSLGRPGGNITGFGAGLTVQQKRLEILHEITPNATQYALLVNPTNPFHPAFAQALEAAARHLKIGLIRVEVLDPSELSNAFTRIKGTRAAGVVVIGDPMFATNMQRIIELALQGRLPSVVSSGFFVRAGALSSFAVDHVDLIRRAAVVVDRILRGAVPADIPVEEARKFEMVLNLKTAKALGLTIPRSLRLRADEVIE